VRHPKIIIASISLAAAAAIGGGVTAAAATSPSASTLPAASQHAGATVRTTQSTFGGKTETILVTSQGLPLYYYLNDTAAKSAVTGELAAVWPPLTSASPAATGLTGKLAAVMDAHGDQVAYNGHLLYTFVGDQAGQVTGQGVERFFVATPGLTPIAGSSTAGSSTAGSSTAGSSTAGSPATAGTAPAASSGNGYGY
jgi:predicted lipoprotein with Yx(FWY)xxD motif